MKGYNYYIIFSFVFFTTLFKSPLIYSQCIIVINDNGKSKRLEYKFGDEFQDTKLNREKWNDSYGWARSIYCNKELQYYSPESNYLFENGKIIIQAKKENVFVKTVDWQHDTAGLYCGKQRIGDNKTKYNYTSGMIQSKEKCFYGYYEIRFKAPQGSGFWPAFWLYGGYENDEIDVFELKGEKISKVHVDVHCPSGCDNFKYALGLKKNWGTWLKCNRGLDQDFNVMGLWWDKNMLKWYLNGECIAAFNNYSFTHPMNIIANLALANDNGPFNPGPNDKTPFPANFEIDYIRYFSMDSVHKNFSNTEMISTTEYDKPLSFVTKKNKSMMAKEKANTETFISILPADNNSLFIRISGKRNHAFAMEVKNAEGQIITGNKISDNAFLYNLPSVTKSFYLVNILGAKSKIEEKIIFP
jgi:beta-glucanase (GH16 family)